MANSENLFWVFVSIRYHEKDLIPEIIMFVLSVSDPVSTDEFKVASNWPDMSFGRTVS